jgi:hypothetical protein
LGEDIDAVGEPAGLDLHAGVRADANVVEDGRRHPGHAAGMNFDRAVPIGQGIIQHTAREHLEETLVLQI